MIDDLVLRWIVTGLFLVSAAECVFALIGARRSAVASVSHLLHFVMAVAMAVMAWPRGAALPTTGPMLFFLAATVWFIVLVLAQSGHRLINAYHASMMLAMAWMYAVMSGDLLPTAADGGTSQVGGGGHHGSSSMPGMDMPDMSGPHTPTPPFIDGLNWLCTIGFAVAALWWTYRYIERRRTKSATSDRYFGIACQAMMAAGMAVMFGVML